MQHNSQQIKILPKLQTTHMKNKLRQLRQEQLKQDVNLPSIELIMQQDLRLELVKVKVRRKIDFYSIMFEKLIN